MGLCVLWVLCGTSKATARCYTSICDGIITFDLLKVVMDVEVEFKFWIQLLSDQDVLKSIDLFKDLLIKVNSGIIFLHL